MGIGHNSQLFWERYKLQPPLSPPPLPFSFPIQSLDQNGLMMTLYGLQLEQSNKDDDIYCT